MLTRAIRRITALVPKFYFSGAGAHGHHEFNRDKITLRDEGTGIQIITQGTIWIQPK